MNLVFDATSLNIKRKDGLNRYIESLIHYLKEHNDSSTEEINTSNITYLISDNVTLDARKKVYNKLLHAPDFRAVLCRYFTQQFVIPFKAKKESILYFPVPEGKLYKSRGQKQVVTVHDLLPLEYPEVFPKVKYHFKHYLPKVLNASDLVITVSDFTANQLKEKYNYKGKVETIYQGYREDIFYKRAANEVEYTKEKYNINGEYVITVGETRKYKNLFSIIKAFQFVESDITLVIVGKINRLDAETIPLIKSLNLKDRVLFLGFVPDEDLAALYSGANSFVFMSLYEGFGIPNLEAMACGAPLVLSNIAPFKEVATDVALFSEPTDLKTIAANIETFYNKKEFRDEMINKGYKRVTNFTWKKFIVKFSKLINSVGKDAE